MNPKRRVVPSKKKPNKIVYFVYKNYKIILLVLIGMGLTYIFTGSFNIIWTIILWAALGFLGITTLEVSRVVPHISVETISGSAMLMGYLFGYKIGFIYGITLGMFGYIKIGQIKLTTIVNALFMGLCGVMAATFGSLGLSFWWSFFFAFMIRMNLGFFIFRNLNPDLLENIMHSYGDGTFNILIVFPLLNVIYSFVSPLIGGG